MVNSQNRTAAQASEGERDLGLDQANARTDPVEQIREQVARDRASGADASADLFDEGEGRREDGSRGLPKITMASIRAFPERCKQQNNGNGAPMKIATFTGVATGIHEAPSVKTGEIFFGLKGDFAAVRYDNDGEPDAIFKSDTLYFPIGHQKALDAVERSGYLSFSLEFWTQPTDNPAGYSWYYNNLAKLDRNNLSPIDKLITMSVNAGRELDGKQAPGLLADLRRPAPKLLPDAAK